MTIDPVGTCGFVKYYGRNSLKLKDVTQQYFSGAMILDIINIKLLVRVCFYPCLRSFMNVLSAVCL